MINSPTLLTALAPPSPAPGGTWPRLPRRGLKRPRGLWKARRRLDTASSLAQHHRHQLSGGGGATSNSSGRGSDTDREMDESGGEEDCGDDILSQDSGSSKRQRRDSGSRGSVELWAVFVEANAESRLPRPPLPSSSSSSLSSGSACGAQPGNNDDATRGPSLISDMVTTSIAERASCAKETFEYKDWEEIKDTLTRASELCDRDDPSGSIPLLRAVIHQSHRFLVRFPDPSFFFSPPLPPPVDWRRQREGSPRSPRSPDSTATRSGRNGNDRMSPSPSPNSDVSWSEEHLNNNHHRVAESPNALHSALGVALFLFGNIIAQNPSLALSREPTTPSPYWHAALDVLNAGDNLPCQTNGNDASPDFGSADDWRVAIAWGRTLVALAYEATKPPTTPSSSSSSSSSSLATARPSPPRSRSPPYLPPPRYPLHSPLAAIAALRTAGLMHHGRATAPELLTLAADQLSRGIFHMPHTLPLRASRPQVLFTLASEVLAVAERLDDTVEQRRRWAAWADDVYTQMHMEADVDAWRARVGAARGRCWLAIGSARADELEDGLERGDVGVFVSKEAEDARAALTTAISFFERAKGSASTELCERSLVDMQPWLAEALISLANLTADENTREALYARAQAEGGEAVARELSPRPAARFPSRTAVVRMDES